MELTFLSRLFSGMDNIELPGFEPIYDGLIAAPHPMHQQL